MPIDEKLTPSPNFPLQAALFEAGLGVVAIGLAWASDLWPREVIRVNASAVGLSIAAVLPLLAMLLACQWLAWRPIKEVRRVLDEVVVPLFRGCNWIDLAAISLLAGIGEELLFRGVFQTSLADWSGDFLPHTPAAALVGDWFAIIVVAVLFGTLHAMNFAYAALASIMGIYLGWLFLATGNLVVPMLAHGLYDFVALAYMLRRATGDIPAT